MQQNQNMDNLWGSTNQRYQHHMQPPTQHYPVRAPRPPFHPERFIRPSIFPHLPFPLDSTCLNRPPHDIERFSHPARFSAQLNRTPHGMERLPHPPRFINQTQIAPPAYDHHSYPPPRPGFGASASKPHAHICTEQPNPQGATDANKPSSVTSRIVHDWLKGKSDIAANNKVTVDENKIKDRLGEILVLLNELKCLKTSMTRNIADISGEEKRMAFQKARDIKRQIEQLRASIDPSVCQRLQKRITAARKRRERLKRKRQAAYKTRLMEIEKRATLHQEIDCWQKGIHEKLQEQKVEEELKEIADKTLGEVRQSVIEAKRALDTLTAIAKLRNARKQGLQQTGLYVSQDSDVMFKQRHSTLVDILTKQLRSYQENQRLLQLMLDSEKAELEAHDVEQRERQRTEKRDRMARKIRHQLFGPQDGFPPDHPLFTFFMYFDVANRSEFDLVRIRREWDSYLIPSESDLGSLIPAGFVQPAPPSSAAWANTLTCKEKPG